MMQLDSAGLKIRVSLVKVFIIILSSLNRITYNSFVYKYFNHIC